MTDQESNVKAMLDGLSMTMEDYTRWCERCISMVDALRREVESIRENAVWMAKNIAMTLVYVECTKDNIPEDVRNKIKGYLYANMPLLPHQKERMMKHERT